MIRKIRTGRWQTPHAHHDPKRGFAKLEGWGFPRQSRPTEQGEQRDEELVSRYPDAVLKVFEEAMMRCPSSISMGADVMEGQPCIAGTRIPIRSILRAIEHYGSIDEAVRCYPDLTKEQVQDALFFSQVVLEPSRGIDKTTLAP